jgi:hypothetical protein
MDSKIEKPFSGYKFLDPTTKVSLESSNSQSLS